VAAGAVQGLGFYTGEDGYIYCDNMRVDDIRQQVADSPFYLYSRDRITANYQAYATVGAAKAVRMYLDIQWF
jgi:diaminopimelate decarboxylase